MFLVTQSWQDGVNVWTVSCDDGGSFSVEWSDVPILSVTFNDEQYALAFCDKMNSSLFFEL